MDCLIAVRPIVYRTADSKPTMIIKRAVKDSAGRRPTHPCAILRDPALLGGD